MLKDIKATNEKILAEHFQPLFGEDYLVDVNWGFPFVVINVTLENKDVKTITKINIDMMQEGNFQLQMLGGKKVYEELPEDAPEGATPLFSLVPDWNMIDSNTINFVASRIKEITEQFFTTRKMPEVPAEEVPDLGSDEVEETEASAEEIKE